MHAYIYLVTADELHGPPPAPRAGDAGSRWELYRPPPAPSPPRPLPPPPREELAAGEPAEPLREGHPKIPRHAAALRDAGLIAARKQGTWTLLRLAPGA